MTGGDIAGLIAAGVFAILVALLAVPIIKLGRVFDELRVWIRDLNSETEPLIDEVVRTVATTNSQLEKVDGITDNVSDASANVSAMTSLVASTVGQPIIKVAAFSSGVRRAFSPEASRARRAQEQRMRAAAHGDFGVSPTTAGADQQPSNDDAAAPFAAQAPSDSTAARSDRPWWEGTEFDTPRDRRPAETSGASESTGSVRVGEVTDFEVVESTGTEASDPEATIIEGSGDADSTRGSGRHRRTEAGGPQNVNANPTTGEVNP